MTKELEIRALEALVAQLDEKLEQARMREAVKWEEHLAENTRITTLIAVIQQAYPLSSRSVIAKTIEELKLKGDTECDLLDYYDEMYEG